MTVTTYQSDYSKKRAIGLPGQVSSEEKSNRISRTVESAAGLAFGQPAFRGSGDNGCVVGASFAGTGTATALAGNTGNGAMGAITVSAGAKEGDYNLLIVEPGTNAGVFEVTDPDGEFVGRGSVGSAFSAGGLAFTLADGATDFVGGDGFTIAVAFTANIQFLGLAILNPAVPANATTPDSYPQYFTAALMTMGTMYETAGATVAQGDDVYWNPATKRFTNTTTHVRIPDAQFEGAAADGDIVEISLRLRS
jgi:hypothetical protein